MDWFGRGKMIRGPARWGPIARNLHIIELKLGTKIQYKNGHIMWVCVCVSVTDAGRMYHVRVSTTTMWLLPNMCPVHF